MVKTTDTRIESSARYRLLPTSDQRELLGWQKNTVRQVNDHALYRLDQLPEDSDQTVRQRVWSVRDELPSTLRGFAVFHPIKAPDASPTFGGR